MQRIALAGSVMLSIAALVVAVLALHDRRHQSGTYAEVGAASVAELHRLISQDEVRAILGTPASVFRSNSRAQCWAYNSPFEVRMCFGPKRRLAWWASNVPYKHSQT